MESTSYIVFLTPVAKAYNFVVPDVVQTGIFNIFQNLFEPSRVANDLFQGEWGYAGNNSMCFLANTTPWSCRLL